MHAYGALRRAMRQLMRIAPAGEASRADVRNCVLLVYTGADPGGGHGGPMPPPFGTEPARNAEVCYALSARSYFNAVHISV